VDHHECSGCSLCLLVCPVWRETRDVRLTPRGRAKAIQHGASAQAIVDSVRGCTLCGACEPACPEKLPLVDMVMELRRDAPLPEVCKEIFSRKTDVLLAGRILGSDAARRNKTLALLGEAFELAKDEGPDIALALESGATLAADRLQRFLAPLRAARRLVVAESILLRPLRRWLPGVECVGIGEALTPVVRQKLRAGDLYVIESRAFNGDHARLVGHYDDLRTASGCEMNLDLQRIAIPATGQAHWILEGREVTRIVVEDLGDRAVFSFSDRPVLHLVDLA
jgi:ferredoxin